MEKKLATTERLLTMMNELREKCPWDREQTFDSLRNNTIEECFELIDAISSGNMDDIKEELGDVLLHIVFYSRLAEEQGAFNYADVVETLCDKLTYRHPHIYADTVAATPTEVKLNWEKLKLRKKSRKSGLLGGVPRSLPAMIKAIRIGAKAAGIGFDWQQREDVWSKVQEEIGEINVEIEAKDQEALEGEFGDLFFALINAARLYNVDPEAALERTNKKFMSRFNSMEALAGERGLEFTELSLDEMEALWVESKQKE